MVQWLRCCTSIVGGTNLIPGWGTKIPTCYVARRWGPGEVGLFFFFNFLTENKSYLLHCFYCKNELLTKESPHQNFMGERITVKTILKGCADGLFISVSALQLPTVKSICWVWWMFSKASHECSGLGGIQAVPPCPARCSWKHTK